MNRFLTLFLFLISFTSLCGQELKQIAVIDLKSADFKKILTEKVEFVGKGAKSTLTSQALDLSELLNSKIGSMTEAEKKSLIVCFESEDGAKMISDFCDFNTNITKIAPYIIIHKKTARFGDTLTITDKMLKDDDNAFDKAIEVPVMKRIHLQFERSLAEPFMKKERSVIFPIDNSPARWIERVATIKIYQIK